MIEANTEMGDGMPVRRGIPPDLDGDRVQTCQVAARRCEETIDSTAAG